MYFNLVSKEKQNALGMGSIANLKIFIQFPKNPITKTHCLTMIYMQKCIVFSIDVSKAKQVTLEDSTCIFKVDKAY